MARGATAAQPEQKEQFILMFPEGRVINNSLLVRDAFKSSEKAQASAPMYRVEMAYDQAALAEVMDKLFEWAKGEYGEDIYFDIDGKPDDAGPNTLEIVTPFIDGNAQKAKRERKGKQGDAYAGKVVVRSKTQFNRDGLDAEGGADIWNGALEPITAINRSELYNGMFANVAVAPAAYDTNEGKPGITFYFKALQKTRDGDPLVSKQDTSKLFQPLQKGTAQASGAGAAPAGRARSRK